MLFHSPPHVTVLRVRPLAGLLLLLMLVQTAGPMLVFSIQQQQVRREIRHRIKAGVSEDQLVHLAIPVSLEKKPNSRFRRMHSREFRFDGHMYDIVRQKQIGDTTFYACIADDEETALFANLQQMIRDEMQHNPERQRQRQDAQRLLDSQFLVNVAASSQPVAPEFFCTQQGSARPHSFIPIPPTPPPELPV